MSSIVQELKEFIENKGGDSSEVTTIAEAIDVLDELLSGGSDGGSSSEDGCKIISVGTGLYPDLVPNAYFSSEADLASLLANIYENKTPANFVLYYLGESGEYGTFYHLRQYHFYENNELRDDGFDLEFHDDQVVGGGYHVQYHHNTKEVTFIRYADE